MCGNCNGFLSKRFISRHLKVCSFNSSKPALQVPLNLIKNSNIASLPEEFVKDVLSNLRNDQIGLVCKQDSTILTIGLRLHDKMKRKCDKTSEVLKSVRNDMRRLAHLYSIFNSTEGVLKKYNNAMDMFNRVNFEYLRTAIDTYTTSEEYLKSGLKIVLSSLIKKSAKIMKGTVLT